MVGYRSTAHVCELKDTQIYYHGEIQQSKSSVVIICSCDCIMHELMRLGLISTHKPIETRQQCGIKGSNPMDLTIYWIVDLLAINELKSIEALNCDSDSEDFHEVIPMSLSICGSLDQLQPLVHEYNNSSLFRIKK